MAKLLRMWRRLMFIFRRDRMDQDLAEEMRLHLEMKTQEKKEAGLSEERARQAASRDFGNAVLLKEVSREMWGWTSAESIAKDVRYGLRMLAKNPGFSTMAVVTLALGIGASTAIFSIVHAVVIRPLPFEHPEQLVTLWKTDRQFSQTPVSGPDFLDWAKQNDVFSALAAGAIYDPALTGAGGAEHLYGIQVTPEFFKVLGIEPAKGRAFLPSEDQPGRNHVVVLGKGFWTWGPGGDLAAVGKTLTLDGEKFTVIGTMPEAFRFPQIWGITDPEIFAPFPLDRLQKNRNANWMWVIGRLKPGVTIKQAQAEMSTIALRLAQQYPESNSGIGVKVMPLHEEVEHGTRPVLILLLCAVGFLLLIACANVANMLLAEAGRRQRETGIRLAIGASRWRVIMQLLRESVLLALLGGGAGILLAYWLKESLVSLSPEGFLPQTNPIDLNLWVLGFAVAVSVATGILFGLVPALQATKTSLEESLKEGARSSGAGARAHRFRNALVACEVALALLLLVGGGLMIRSLVGLLRADTGFNPNNVLTMQVTLADSKYPQNQQRRAFYRSVLERIEALPGVRSAAFVGGLPDSGNSYGNVVAEGKPLTPSAFAQGPTADFNSVTPDFFRVLEIPMLSGRLFASADYVGKPHNAVINATMARDLWPDRDPIGRRFTPSLPGEWFEVVGVVTDVRWWGEEKARPQAYFPQMTGVMSLLVRTAADPKSLIKSLRAQILEVDKDVPVYEIQTMEQVRSQASSSIRYIALIMDAFAFIALILAAVGIYAVVAHSVTQRTHEIGVRLALGAEQRDVLRLVVRQGMLLILIGVAAGVTAALAITRLMKSLLYGIHPADPLTFVAVSLLLSAIAIVACYIPARRAMKVDPMVALRYE